MRIENRTSIDKLERQKTEKALTPTRKKLYTNKFISIKTIRTEDEGNSDYEKRNKIKEKEDKPRSRRLAEYAHKMGTSVQMLINNYAQVPVPEIKDKKSAASNRK